MSENLNEPQSRTEEILQNALGEEYEVVPQSRVEQILDDMVDGETTDVIPRSRVEELLLKLSESGGGDKSGFELLDAQSIGHVSTSITSPVSVGSSFTMSFNDYRIYLFVTLADEIKENTHAATICIRKQLELSQGNIVPYINFMFDDNGAIKEIEPPTTTTSYGFYPKTQLSDGVLNITGMNARYHSVYTNTIDNDYTFKVYGIKMADILY